MNDNNTPLAAGLANPVPIRWDHKTSLYTATCSTCGPWTFTTLSGAEEWATTHECEQP